MTLSIGIARDQVSWKICLLENAQVLEWHDCVDEHEAFHYLKRTCGHFPEITIALALPFEVPYISLSANTEHDLHRILAAHLAEAQVTATTRLLSTIRSFSLHSYIVPSVRFLPSLPAHRKLLSANLGNPNDVCVVAALLARLRASETPWPEMNFFCVRLDSVENSILVLEAGRIVNGDSQCFTAHPVVSLEVLRNPDSQEMLALWEGLQQRLGGLMAVHHLEDIVIVGEYRNEFSEHFAERYPVYLFPYQGTDKPGFEAAFGAAVLAEGLYRPGSTADVVEQLQIREAV
jgi:predicted butyrate kinase (DUF1464 family)